MNPDQRRYSRACDARGRYANRLEVRDKKIKRELTQAFAIRVDNVHSHHISRRLLLVAPRSAFSTEHPCWVASCNALCLKACCDTSLRTVSVGVMPEAEDVEDMPLGIATEESPNLSRSSSRNARHDADQLCRGPSRRRRKCRCCKARSYPSSQARYSVEDQQVRC
jgi:hypothetical protein